MTSTEQIENWVLHAYADGELDEKERESVEARLAADPAARAELDSWARQKTLLKDAYDGVLTEPVPRSIAAALRHSPRVSRVFLPALAASFIALIIGGFGGFFLALQSGAPRDVAFADTAISAYEIYSPEKRHAVEVAANDREHLTTWLSKRVGAPLTIPDLTSRGFNLLGGRLLSAEGRPAAQFMYEDEAKRRITVFVAANPGSRETAFLITEKDGVTACYWLDGKLGFVIAGEQGRDELMQLASLVYAAFDAT
ncbi:anti-sigma factor [soil metagenome]